ncbi:MAG: hypothetical protein NVV60_12965 [Luteimonas sp.]|nr:hypothetical protein [Luteimonas sp.]
MQGKTAGARLRGVVLCAALLIAAAPAFASEDVQVVVYEAPRMFFSSPEHAPVLGGPGIGVGPGQPSFGADPGERFAQALLRLLQDRTDAILTLPARAVPGPRTTKQIENPRGSRSLVVFTTMNFLGYRPMRWATYQYGYGAYLRVVDDAARTLVETRCIVKVNKSRPEFQIARDELQAPGRFDAVVDRVVAECASGVVDEIAAAL